MPGAPFGKSARELELEIKLGKHRDEGLVSMLYEARNLQIDGLRLRGEVTNEDLGELDRVGRAVVAAELLSICEDAAIESLLSDEHHFVRSCALVSAQPD